MLNWFELFSSNNDLTAVAKESFSDCPTIGQNQPLKSGTSQAGMYEEIHMSLAVPLTQLLNKVS